MGCQATTLAKQPNRTDSQNNLPESESLQHSSSRPHASFTEAVKENSKEKAIPDASDLVIKPNERKNLDGTSTKTAQGVGGTLLATRFEVIPSGGKQEAAIAKMRNGTATRQEMEEAKRLIIDQFHHQERETSRQRRDDSRQRREDKQMRDTSRQSHQDGVQARQGSRLANVVEHSTIVPGVLVAVSGMAEKAEIVNVAGDNVIVQFEGEFMTHHFTKTHVTVLPNMSDWGKRKSSFKLPRLNGDNSSVPLINEKA